MREPSAAPPPDDAAGVYRSELASAEERVQKLEEELRARGGPREPPPRPLTYMLLGLGASVVVMGAVVGLAVLAVRNARGPVLMDESTPPTTRPVETPSLHGAQWYTPLERSERTPILMDVNGDGQKDLVGLAWDPRDDEHALHAVAFDGKTHQMLWHSEGISTQWMSFQTGIRRDGDTLIVTDSRNELRIIDAHTGQVKTLTLAPAPGATVDEPRDAKEQARNGDLRAATPIPRKKGFFPAEAYPAGDTVATLGWLETGEHVGWLVGWNRKTKAITYEAPLLRPSDTPAPRSGNMHTADADRIYTAFVSADAKQARVVARSLATGELAWTTDVPGTDEGAQFRAMRSEDGQLFVAIDGTLVVLDAAAGREVSRLVAF